jgi:alanyl-tRNA synthetase
MGKLAKQTMQEIDIWLQQADLERDKKLNKQRDEAIKKIEATEKNLLDHHWLNLGNEKKIEKIKEYVMTYKWLPNSYRGMLREMVEEMANKSCPTT